MNRVVVLVASVVVVIVVTLGGESGAAFAQVLPTTTTTEPQETTTTSSTSTTLLDTTTTAPAETTTSAPAASTTASTGAPRTTTTSTGPTTTGFVPPAGVSSTTVVAAPAEEALDADLGKLPLFVTLSLFGIFASIAIMGVQWVKHAPVRVVIDTDIGTDIDDTWALAMAARSPELDIELITTVSGDPDYRARVARGLLGPAVPVVPGLGGGRDVHPGRPQRSLAAHAEGELTGDGVAALVAAAGEPITIIALGPLTNLAAALERDPSIAERARVVAMLGSVRVGYHGHVEPVPEYNVKVDVDACRAVLSAPWSVTITPVDTCGTILLRGNAYQRVLASPDPMVQRLLASYREWLGDKVELFDRRSTTLFDCVAIHLAHDESLVEIEDLPLTIDDDGLMRISEDAPVVRVATRWRDEPAFIEHLVQRLT